MNSKEENPAMREEDFPHKVDLLGEVVLITGGSGFLGQHIVRVLQERAEGLKEIRIADTTPYIQKLPFPEKFPIKFYHTDITIESQLDQAFEGSTAVIHCAASVQVGHYIDRGRMLDINVRGTSNVVNKCQRWNIPKLVFTSTVDTIIEKDSNFYEQSEQGIQLPSSEQDCLIGYYAFTKARSEEIVRSSNTKILANGKYLKTAILRPTVMYGELDPYYVPVVLKTAKSSLGYLPKPSCIPEDAVLQGTYVGNVAWAHVLALAKLGEEIEEDNNKNQGSDHQSDCSINGQVFFITDDTTPKIMYDFMVPFLELRGFSLVQMPLPLFMIGGWVYLSSSLIQWFPDSWKKYVQTIPSLPTYESFQMVHKMIHFSRTRATQSFKYSPIYAPTQALELSAGYYKDVTI